MKSKTTSKRKILFVCFASLCKSPVAVAVLNLLVRKDYRLRWSGFSLDSTAIVAGVYGKFGPWELGYEPKMLDLDILGHVSKPIGDLHLAEYDLILTMDSSQKAYIVGEHPELEGRIFRLKEFAGRSGNIADPVKTGKYLECAGKLEKYLLKAVERLENTSIDKESHSTSRKYKSNMPWKWIEGVVDKKEEHVEITYSDIRKDEKEIPIAIVAPGEHVFVVQFIYQGDQHGTKMQSILKEVTHQLDFFLVEKGDEDPWAYVQYHCTYAAANLYSNVHWGWILKGWNSGVKIVEQGKKIQVEDKVEKQKGRRLLTGTAASKGIVVGFVRNIGNSDPQLMGKMVKGEVIVAEGYRIAHENYPFGESMDFLRMASAFVTDGGGTTCSAAIVARELGIPAVTGTIRGSTTLATGQKIIVDGTEGAVYSYD
jgi:protein-tyrosine-phosphatase/phosphohistidine swiveling domain-containing protein